MGTCLECFNNDKSISMDITLKSRKVTTLISKKESSLMNIKVKHITRSIPIKKFKSHNPKQKQIKVKQKISPIFKSFLHQKNNTSLSTNLNSAQNNNSPSLKNAIDNDIISSETITIEPESIDSIKPQKIKKQFDNSKERGNNLLKKYHKKEYKNNFESELNNINNVVNEFNKEKIINPFEQVENNKKLHMNSSSKIIHSKIEEEENEEDQDSKNSKDMSCNLFKIYNKAGEMKWKKNANKFLNENDEISFEMENANTNNMIDKKIRKNENGRGYGTIKMINIIKQKVNENICIINNNYDRNFIITECFCDYLPNI